MPPDAIVTVPVLPIASDVPPTEPPAVKLPLMLLAAEATAPPLFTSVDAP